MRKTILSLLIAIFSKGAMAAWTEVGATAIFSAYADSTTISKDGSKVKMWDLFDFSITQTVMNKQFLSIKSQREFDCKDKALRLRYTTYHSLKMGAGNIVNTSNLVRDWAPVSPESIDEILWKFACGKK